jgi:2-oxoglutarate dehydrogenase E1 component
LKELANGKWMPVLDDDEASQSPLNVRRLVLCSGKIAIDLLESEFRNNSPETAIIRLEQLCPFPADELKAVIDRYERAEEIVWAQEEPQNMGAWAYVRPKIAELTGERLPLQFIGRPASPSSSEGSFTLYSLNQKDLVKRVFQSGEPKKSTAQRKTSKER